MTIYDINLFSERNLPQPAWHRSKSSTAHGVQKGEEAQNQGSEAHLKEVAMSLANCWNCTGIKSGWLCQIDF